MRSLQLDRPHAIVVIGIKGSGKTFFAQKFADTFNAPFIEQARFDASVSTAETSQVLMEHVLSEILKTGKSVVVELSLSSRTERAQLAKLLRTAGYATMFVWVQVDIDSAMNRAYRSHRVSEADYREQMRRFSPPHQSEKPLVVSGKHTFATQAKAVLRKLSSPRQVSPQQPIVTPTRSQQTPQAPQRGQIIVR